MIRVLLANNPNTTCRGLEMLLRLEPDIHIIGTTADGCVLEMAESLSPQVVAIDLDTRECDALETIRTLRARGGRALLVAVSKYDSAKDRRVAREAGAHAFFSKMQDPQELVDIIRQLATLPAV